MNHQKHYSGFLPGFPQIPKIKWLPQPYPWLSGIESYSWNITKGTGNWHGLSENNLTRKRKQTCCRGGRPVFSWKTTSSHLHVIADQKCMTVLKKRKDYSAAVVLCYMRIQGSHRQCHSIEHHNVKYSASSQEHFKIVSSYIKFGVLFCKYWIPPHTRWVLSFIVKQNRIFEWKFNMHTHAHQNGHQYSWAQSSKNCSTHILTELSYLQPVIIL